MARRDHHKSIQSAGASCTVKAAAFVLLTILTSTPSFADESGVSFWVPGLFGSLAALPGQPGWSWATTFYHTSVAGGGSQEFTIGGRVVAGIDATADVAYFGPAYVFEQPVLGAQAAVSLTAVGGRNDVTINATLIGPRGNAISGALNQSLTSFGDLYPLASLKWHKDNNNFITYVMGDIPVGDYDPKRIANLGIGHGAIDGGGGYTYFDEKKGHEFSAVAGFTYNFINPDTDYQSGVDFHLDWGASQFLTKQFLIGAVGYVYQQVTGDSGSGARLGPFESRVIGIGPQAGLLFPIDEDIQGYVNVKAYEELNHDNRPDGWNLWLTLSFSPAAKSSTEASAKNQQPLK